MGNATIDVRVREVGQLFNSMDPSPFRERELDDDAEAYIVDSIKELGSRTPSAIVIKMSNAMIQLASAKNSKRSESKNKSALISPPASPAASAYSAYDLYRKTPTIIVVAIKNRVVS